MPPKKGKKGAGGKKEGKGGKKGGKKKAEPTDEDLLTEVQKELFQIQITDLQQKVERMKTRCLELEVSNEEYQKRYEQLDEDRADIIAYLKKMLQEKEDEITELKERLEGLLKELDQDRQMYEEKIANLQHEFKVMHEQLTSEIKLLTGKLNSLEEFRLQRDDLMKKFKDQEIQMEEQEERHKRTIYEIERKFIIGKDMLKQEMESKLLQLSLDFQDATHLRIAATTHRTIRENIAINNELVRMVEASEKLTKENEMMKGKFRTLSLEVKLREEERDTMLEKNMVQLKLIKRLSAEYEEMTKHIGELQYSAQRCEELQQELKDNAALVDRAVKQISTLEECLEAAQYENSELMSRLFKSERDTYALQRVLKEAVRSIKDAVLVQLEPHVDEAYNLSRREDLLSNLLQLLNTGDLPDFEGRERRMQDLVTTSAIYEIGDLGLVPRSSSELKIESETHTIGSNYPSKESVVQMHPVVSSQFRKVLSSSTVSTLTESEHSSTTESAKKSTKTSSSSSGSRKSATKPTLSKQGIVEETPQGEETEGSPEIAEGEEGHPEIAEGEEGTPEIAEGEGHPEVAEVEGGGHPEITEGKEESPKDISPEQTVVEEDAPAVQAASSREVKFESEGDEQVADHQQEPPVPTDDTEQGQTTSTEEPTEPTEPAD